MRLWSIHPKYLDVKGLSGCWREALLAQNVLLGKTVGYKNHPQLIRFVNTENPVEYIGSYLRYIHEEAVIRGYNFNVNKIIINNEIKLKIPVTTGQIKYELEHLKNKLKLRDVKYYDKIKDLDMPDINPLFYIVNGDIEDWEKLEVVSYVRN